MKAIERENKLCLYKGPSLKVRIAVSDQQFIASTKVLCNARNGNNRFLRQILGINDDDDDQEGGDNDELKQNGQNSNQAKQPGQFDQSSMIELFFDRNPKYFGVILDYLRGYNMCLRLRAMNVTELEWLLDDAAFYRLGKFVVLIQDILSKRFDVRYCSPLIELSCNGSAETRKGLHPGLHHGCAVYGILKKGKRYVEFQIMSHGNRYIMFGVTEADNYSFAPYPGHTGTRGCSYSANSGNCYRGGGNEGWGPVMSCGDKCGILVEINDDNNTATVAWYVNGKLVKQPQDLKQYMDVSKGVVFVATMYSASEMVAIVQSPLIPQ